MIQQWDTVQEIRGNMFGLLSCCLKVRWPCGVSILERNDEYELRMKPEFYETFMSEKGWGVTPEFISRYPRLFQGMDVSVVIHEVI